MAAMWLQMGRNNGGPENLFCDSLQLEHFVHQVVDIGGCNVKIRLVPEACVGGFQELEPRSFGGCCSDKDLVHIGQVKAEKRQRFIEIVAAVPKPSDSLRQHTQELLGGLVQTKSGHTELSVLLLAFRDPQETQGVLVPAGDFPLLVGGFGNEELVGADAADDVSIFIDPMIGLEYRHGKGVAFAEQDLEFFRRQEQCGDGNFVLASLLDHVQQFMPGLSGGPCQYEQVEFCGRDDLRRLGLKESPDSLFLAGECQ